MLNIKFGEGSFRHVDKLVKFVIVDYERYLKDHHPFSDEDVTNISFLNADYYDGETIGVFQKADRFDEFGIYKDAIDWLNEKH